MISVKSSLKLTFMIYHIRAIHDFSEELLHPQLNARFHLRLSTDTCVSAHV